MECPAASMASIMKRVPNLKGKTEETISRVAKVNDKEHLLSVCPMLDIAPIALHIPSQKAQTQRACVAYETQLITSQSGNSNVGLPDSKTFSITIAFTLISSYMTLTKTVDIVSTVNANAAHSNI